MSTKAKNDPMSITLDARRVLAAAREDVADAAFGERVRAAELTKFERNIEALEACDGTRLARLRAKVAAGVRAAEARAAIVAMCADVRDDAKIVFPDDGVTQHAFGVGAHVSAASTTAVGRHASALLAAASVDPARAAKIGLTANGVEHLKGLVELLHGADITHHDATTAWQATAATTGALARLVSAESAHLRLVARRVFRGDESALARYARGLPRHAVVHHAPAPTGQGSGVAVAASS